MSYIIHTELQLPFTMIYLSTSVSKHLPNFTQGISIAASQATVTADCGTSLLSKSMAWLSSFHSIFQTGSAFDLYDNSSFRLDTVC